MEHKLTAGEKSLLSQMFGSSIPYDDITCKINTLNVGGSGNSITPEGTPYFSRGAYRNDFSTVSIDEQWIFLHEFTHVWQYYQSTSVVWAAIKVFVSKHGDYDSTYSYDLTTETEFSKFNIEQQGAIVADFWVLSHGGKPRYNASKNPSLAQYQNVITDFANLCNVRIVNFTTGAI